MTPIYYELSEEQRNLRTINDNAKPLPMDYAIGALFLTAIVVLDVAGLWGMAALVGSLIH